jgi:NADH-quinone oxidoreductase subunit I
MYRRRLWVADIVMGTVSIAKGMAVTFANVFRHRITENYPAVTRPAPPRLRGRLVHLRDDEGRLKCTACLACQKACPSIAIPTIEGDEKKGRERRAKAYIWDAGRCLFCGYCVEACPFNALRMGPQHSVVGESRATLLVSLEELLEPRRGGAGEGPSGQAPAEEGET